LYLVSGGEGEKTVSLRRKDETSSYIEVWIFTDFRFCRKGVLQVCAPHKMTNYHTYP
jgi:hypothetical protein